MVALHARRSSQSSAVGRESRWGQGLGFRVTRKVDVRLPGKGDSNCHGARPVHRIITMIHWIRTRRLSIKNSLSLPFSLPPSLPLFLPQSRPPTLQGYIAHKRHPPRRTLQVTNIWGTWRCWSMISSRVFVQDECKITRLDIWKRFRGRSGFNDCC